MSSFFIAVPLIVFCIFVAPLWLILHYRSKRKTGDGLSDEELQLLRTRRIRQIACKTAWKP